MEVISLENILNEAVIFEGRKEDVMAKYPDVSKDMVEYLSQNDPSGNNKYLEWMVKEVNTGRDRGQIVSAVRRYHENLSLATAANATAYAAEAGRRWDKALLEKLVKSPKDINSFASSDLLAQFNDFLSTIVTKKKESEQLKKESDRIYEDDKLVVVSPKTHKASCSYGIHSAWCVATSNTSHFGNYTKNGNLYFFLDKTNKPPTRYWSDKDDGNPPYKTALLLKDNGEISWWSKGDSNYSNGWVGDKNLPFLTKEIADKVMAHNKYAIENRKQREIERILISKGFYKRTGSDSTSKGDFTGFVRSKIFKAEQIISIIRNDNWLALYENSETGKMVREVLGKEVIFSLVREMITTVDNLPEALKDLHSQEFLSTISASFSDDQNREIAQTIEKRMGKKPTSSEVGGDVKMYVDKWTMSPEQWAIYEQSSSYFFIGKVQPMEIGVNGDGTPQYEKSMNVETIVKGDRFNPKDHHSLQMMMLRAKMSQSGLYALVTDKDSLDKYIGKSGTDFPPEVRKSIMDNAKKLG